MHVLRYIGGSCVFFNECGLCLISISKRMSNLGLTSFDHLACLIQESIISLCMYNVHASVYGCPLVPTHNTCYMVMLSDILTKRGPLVNNAM